MRVEVKKETEAKEGKRKQAILGQTRLNAHENIII
jgi:hypothetical protein